MPNKIDGYECSICKTFYSQEKEAISCEEKHPLKDNMKIDGAVFACLDGTHGMDRQLKIAVPTSIRIKFSEKYGDFAFYTFKQYGPRGV